MPLTDTQNLIVNMLKDAGVGLTDVLIATGTLPEEAMQLRFLDYLKEVRDNPPSTRDILEKAMQIRQQIEQKVNA